MEEYPTVKAKVSSVHANDWKQCSALAYRNRVQAFRSCEGPSGVQINLDLKINTHTYATYYSYSGNLWLIKHFIIKYMY